MSNGSEYEHMVKKRILFKIQNHKKIFTEQKTRKDTLDQFEDYKNTIKGLK